MKARSVFATVASVALATTMVVGLTACKTSAKSVKGEEVDNATWVAALSAEAFKDGGTVEFTMESKDKDDEGKEGTMKAEYTVKSSGTIVYVKGSEKYTGAAIEDDVKSRKVEAYIDMTAGRKVVYKNDGKWVEVKGEDDYKNLGFSTVAASMVQMTPVEYADAYEGFEYSKSDKGYVEKEAEEGSKTVIKIVDKKLKAYISEESGDKGSSSISMVYDYGKVELEMPTVE